MDAARPRLGVVVLNWNGRSHLERLLPTLRAALPEDGLAVVADNGSEDDSLTWLAAEHPWVTVVENGSNLRFAAGNNRGARAAMNAGAEVLLFLNDDTTVEAEALDRLMAALEADPSLGVVGPRICWLDRPQRIWYGGGHAVLPLGWIAHRALGRDARDGADPAGPTDWVTGCALAVRADVYASLGGLDESFYIYSEDVDFCLRARQSGWRIAYVPDATIWHAVSASTGAHTAFKAYHKSRARRLLLERHLVGWRRRTALVSARLQEWMLYGLHVLRGRSAAAAGLRAAWADPVNGAGRYPAPETPTGV